MRVRGSSRGSCGSSGPRTAARGAGCDEGARNGDLQRGATPADTAHRSPAASSIGIAGLGGGGNLRAAVFGVNDGLVSNASLIFGVAGANSDPAVVLLTGVAGLTAGAFAMATGEFVSVRSQRELFEYQIGLERDELDGISGRRGAGARA